jgi:hypothetical protein
MLVNIQDNAITGMTKTHLVSCGLFIVSAGTYLIVSNVDNLEPPEKQAVDVTAGEGIYLFFAVAGVSILTLLHYLFLKRYRAIDMLHGVGLAVMRKAMLGTGGDGLAKSVLPVSAPAE